MLNEIREAGGIVGYSNTPHGRGATKTQKMVVKYTYYIQNKEFINSRIGMGYRQWSLSPFREMQWEIEDRFSETITIFYSSNFPKISVLHRGVDWVLAISLLFTGIGLINFTKFIGLNHA